MLLRIQIYGNGFKRIFDRRCIMRVVSVGDLVTDFYYQDGKLLGVQGGMSAHNIVANLAKNGFDTAVFGVCGNDPAGDIAIQSLKEIGVSVDAIVRRNCSTRCFHVSYFEQDGKLTFTSKKRCPFCSTKHWYEKSLIEPDQIISMLHKDDILVFDNLNEKNQLIIDQVKHVKMLDLGQYFELEVYEDHEIIQKLAGHFCIVNLNERVEKYLLKRFSLNSLVDLFHLLSPKLLIVTRGNRGADIVMNDQVYHYNLETSSSEVDSTGAGDAFFAIFVGEYIKNHGQLSETYLSDTFLKATNLTKLVVTKMGARGHLSSLYKIKKQGKCSCESFTVNQRKPIKRCNININHLETRTLHAIFSSAYEKLKQIDFSTLSSCLFLGSGGSYAGAYFASRVVNTLYGCLVQSCYPRDVLYQNIENIDQLFLFSYSGTTNDLLEGTKNVDPIHKVIVTKGEIAKVSTKTGVLKQNILSYRTSSNKGSERGFLSFEGAVAPASLFLRLYLEQTNEISLSVEDFIKESMRYWKDYFASYFQEHKTMLHEILQLGTVFNLFYGDYTNTAAYDLESKIIESGIFSVVMHEKKNFSHGRFINYEHLSQQVNLYLKQKETTGYEKKLLQYLDGGQTVLIESRYNGILGEYDLLIASQYFMYTVANFLDLDISKPAYSEEAMKIYFYKGVL